MFRIVRSAILIAVLATTLFSCSKYYAITIEQKNLPKINIPAEVQSLTLMNRSLTKDFHNFKEDSLQQFFYRNKYNVKATILDSLASDTCLQTIGELLFGSGRFDIVIPTERNIKKDTEYYRIEQPLDWTFVENICKTYNTDALLVMEKYVNQINSLVQQNYNTIKSEIDIEYSYFWGSCDIIYDSFFRLYYPKNKEILGQFFIIDTISWGKDALTKLKLYSDMNSIKNGLIDAGINVALDLDGSISPMWIPDERGVYIIDNKNIEERNLILNSDWQKLTEYWQPFTENKNTDIRSKAEYNMALAAELNGKIDDAIYWASKSYQTLLRNRSFNYIKKLGKRKIELAKIEQHKDQLYNF